jgi:hypothetical protein
MRKLLWMIVFFCAYVWVMTSGHEQMVLERGKWALNMLISWFDDAELDFQVTKKDKVSKKRSRRWD